MTSSIPGVTLSSLIFSLKATPGDSIGFLLGESYSHESANITDTESRGIKVKRKTCIQQHVFVEGRQSFTDSKGAVNISKLEELLGDTVSPKSVVGWFVYRANCSSRPSLLERSIHSSLMISLPHSPGKNLLFGLFTEVTSDLLSVDYSFYQWIGSRLENVHVDVINLQSTSVAPYQTLPTIPIPALFSTNTQVMKKARELLFLESNELRQCVETEQLCQAVVQSLQSLRDELVSSYKTIQFLNEEVECLRSDLDNKVLNDLNKVRDTESPAPSSPKKLGGKSDSLPLPELIQLGDKLASFTFPPSPSSSASALTSSHDETPQMDLLTGSPPPIGDPPLISDRDQISNNTPHSQDGSAKESETQ
ncbi:PREDICTED: BRCA1-A complex subunit Abraxas-like isoform X2 [Amphimedon queenslandica]|uniref:MPN domain-containing protein n=1 Tax=Amphimedon queenslandica TaxID=400682 RepID=A0A1X7UWJ0_AMPQE|nr:PREDICTED: BRCA1-A complex subunit Abraxas-like isoform X2 [Amphimedon queenslandica]|eukprot:XP_019851885.1 PREDICTED: BRCA1-A complex subunit Abraxas-like isoform X2 [Amphimedon queenslandica]